MKPFSSTTLSLAIVAMASAPAIAAEDGYPTLERTAYVMQCMREKGGQTMDNLYDCSCLVDKVMGRISFDDYTAAQTFIQYKRMPGDKGGIFRDQPQALAVLDALEQAETDAKTHCFVRHKHVTLTPGEKPAAEKPAGE